MTAAEIAQLGERVTEDHKVPGSIPGFGTEHPAACYVFLGRAMMILIRFPYIWTLFGLLSQKKTQKNLPTRGSNPRPSD